MGILEVPLEIFAIIASHIDLEDLFRLVVTCRQLGRLIRDNGLCRVALQVNAIYSREFELAAEDGCYARELRRVLKRRSAASTASPFLISIVAVADDFIYKNGALVYTIRELNLLRLLFLDGFAKEELVFDTYKLMLMIVPRARRHWEHQFKPLYHAHGIVSGILHCFHESNDHIGGIEILCRKSYAVAWNVYTKKILVHYELTHPDRESFILNNDTHLYLGERVRHSSAGYYWRLQGFDLITGEVLEGIYINHELGDDVDIDVAFEIYDDYFYIATTREPFSWIGKYASFYYSTWRFPLGTSDLSSPHYVWRRDVAKGTLDDRWQTLSLEVDEQSGLLYIQEARAENADGIIFRSCYNTPLVTSNNEWADINASRTKVQNTSIDKGEKTRTLPKTLPIPRRPAKAVHRGERNVSKLATPVHTYNKSAQAFVDIFKDPPGGDPWNQSQQRLRLRTRSRTKNRGDRVIALTRGHVYYDEDDYGECRIWPAEEPEYFNPWLDRAYDMLSPQGPVRNIRWASDERCIIYSPESAGHKPGQPKPVILVSFDPGLRFHGLPKLSGQERNDLPLPARAQGMEADGSSWSFVDNAYYTVIQHDDGLPRGYDLTA